MKRKAEYYDALRHTRRGNLTIYDIVETRPKKGSLWRCRCDCGAEFLAETSKLVSGGITCCPACGQAKNKARSREQLTTHGLSKHPLYRIWRAMLSRCYYEGDTDYSYYGGRGILPCKEWRNDFKAFYNWALSNGYEPGLTLDRINVNSDYKPSNCRWITQKEQCSNKRNNVWITVDGETKTQSQWAELLGVSHANLTNARKRGAGAVEEYIRGHLQGGSR